jgi:hypothetical protein
MFAAEARPLRVQPRLLAGLLALCAVVAFASLLAATYNARRDKDMAQHRFADLQALLALPPMSTDSLQEDLDSVKLQIAMQVALSAPPKVDPASDAATSLLVRTAQGAGLSVKGITRTQPAVATFDGVTYNTQGIHVAVDGTSQQVNKYLSDMAGAEPALFPSLTSMSINDKGLAHAELTFSVYAKVVPPTPVPVPTKVKGKT